MHANSNNYTINKHNYRRVQRTLRFSITSRPLINVKSWSHMKKKPVITQKIRNDRVDQYFGRKWSKCRNVIFDH